MERREELEDILIGLMKSLGMSMYRGGVFSMALIRAHHLHEEMIEWIASYKGKEDALTAQAFMSKLNALTTTNN
jgi:hypothetical protein